MRSAAFGATILLSISAVCIAMIAAVGLAVGYVLNWLVPAIDLGVATLCGLVSIVTFTVFFKDLVNLMLQRELDAARAISADDEASLSDEQVENLADQISEAVLLRAVAKDTWNRAKPKGRRSRSDY